MPSCGVGADGGGGRRTAHAVTGTITVTVNSPDACLPEPRVNVEFWNLHWAAVDTDDVVRRGRRGLGQEGREPPGHMKPMYPRTGRRPCPRSILPRGPSGSLTR